MSPAKRAFITAVDSFTGRYLAVELESHGYEVFGTTRRPGRDARYEACDINDREQLEKMFRRTRPDVIFHLAAITFTESDTARDVYTANLLGPLSLLEAISASGITCRKLLRPCLRQSTAITDYRRFLDHARERLRCQQARS